MRTWEQRDLKRRNNMNASGTTLAKTIAGVITSAEPGSFGTVLRGLLMACTAARRTNVRGRDPIVDGLSELIENAAVYAERNGL